MSPLSLSRCHSIHHRNSNSKRAKRKMDVAIRNGRKEDCPVIAEYLRELGDYVGATSQKTAQVHELVEDGFGESPWFKTYVAEIVEAPGRNKIVGVLLYYFYYSMFRKRTVHIEALFVHSTFRNRGIGLSLIKQAAKKALADGCANLTLDVSALNTNAIRMYERHEIIDHHKKANFPVLSLRADETALEKLATSV